jgi:hypothetical protein
MRIFLFLAFVAVPIAEIFLFLQVGSFIGIPATIGLVILTAIAGTMLVRSQGLEVISKIRHAADRGEAPVDALIQGRLCTCCRCLAVDARLCHRCIWFCIAHPANPFSHNRLDLETDPTAHCHDHGT